MTDAGASYSFSGNTIANSNIAIGGSGFGQTVEAPSPLTGRADIERELRTAGVSDMAIAELWDIVDGETEPETRSSRGVAWLGDVRREFTAQAAAVLVPTLLVLLGLPTPEA